MQSLESILDEHRLVQPPHMRLMAIEEELQAAAKVGDTVKVRQLKAQKKHLEQQERQATEAIFAAVKARQIAAPAKGEEAALDKRAKRLESEIARKRGEQEKLLARLQRNPESETLLDKIDRLKTELPELDSELQAIVARQEQIPRWHEEQEQKNELAAKIAEWERKLPDYRRRLETVTSKMVRAWKALDASIRSLDELRELLRDPQRPADPLEKVYEQIRERTGGSVSFSGSRWIFDREVER